MRILRKLAVLLLLAVILLMACYFFQPLKKGKGTDNSIKYELVENWLHLPTKIKLGNPSGLDIDSVGNLVVFHRAGRTWPFIGSMPKTKIDANTILIIDPKSGILINSWGKDLFIMPHGLTIDQQDNIWLTDVALHQIFKFNNKGELLLTIGVAGESGDDSIHFNMPTDIAVAKDGSFYVSDGYGNNRVVKFSAGGKYLFQWGTKGGAQGQFDTPHGIDIDEHGNIYVADRENSRIQIFDSTGKFLRSNERDDIGNVCAVKVKNSKTIFTIDDVSFLKLKHRGSDVILFDSTESIRTRFGRSGSYDAPAGWFHDICIDDNENIYVGDILNNTIVKFKRK